MSKVTRFLWGLACLLMGYIYLTDAGQSAYAAATKKKPTNRLNLRERYERTMIQWALKQAKLTRDLQPEGKRISRIVVVRANVIAPFDPWPNFINYVHVKTRESIILQELLVKAGDVYRQRLVSESERNLRGMSILSTARTVACRAKHPNQVVLLVVTKDIWSLRISNTFQLSGLVLRELSLYPMEANLAGFGKQFGLILRLFQLDLTSFLVRNQVTLGQFYYDPRLFGTRLRLYEEFGIYLDGVVPCAGSIGKQSDVWCPTGAPGLPSGFYASASLTRSLFSLATRWAFSLSVSGAIRQSRGMRQNDDPNQELPPGQRRGLSLSTVEFAHSDGTIHAVPLVYQSRQFTASAGATYSRGYRIKHDFSLSAGVAIYAFDVPDNFPFDDSIRRKFIQYSIPTSESAAQLSIGYSIRSARFIRLHNIRIFGLSEDFSVGPSLSLNATPALDLINPTQQYVSLSASFGYSWLLGGDLLGFSLSGGGRWQPRSNEIGIPGPWLNNYFSASISNITPKLGIGRLFTLASVYFRHNSIDNNVSSIGNSSGVRGIPDGQIYGQHKIQYHAEYRTSPLNFWTLHVGLVAFYEGAAVWGGRNPLRPAEFNPFSFRHSAGIGLRTLFPQFSREVLRIDLGIPIQSDPGHFSAWFSVTFGQAF